MYPPTHVLVFALGCIGALAPEIVRLYKLRKNLPKEVFSLGYYLVSIVYSALGGVVALILPAVTMWAAFYAGITTPTLISTAAKHREKVEIRNMVNRRDQNIVKAIDRSESKTEIIKAQQANVSLFKKNIELIRNHADGLFL
jgi:hypothetical protein